MQIGQQKGVMKLKRYLVKVIPHDKRFRNRIVRNPGSSYKIFILSHEATSKGYKFILHPSKEGMSA